MPVNIKCWTLTYPRPIGIKPTIYLIKPIVEPTVVEDYITEDGVHEQGGVDPYTDPHITEHQSILDAFLSFVEFNNTDDYLRDIKISKTGKG